MLTANIKSEPACPACNCPDLSRSRRRGLIVLRVLEIHRCMNCNNRFSGSPSRKSSAKPAWSWGKCLHVG